MFLKEKKNDFRNNGSFMVPVSQNRPICCNEKLKRWNIVTVEHFSQHVTTHQIEKTNN